VRKPSIFYLLNSPGKSGEGGYRLKGNGPGTAKTGMIGPHASRLEFPLWIKGEKHADKAALRLPEKANLSRPYQERHLQSTSVGANYSSFCGRLELTYFYFVSLVQYE